jgi:cysteine desulfurase
MPTQQSVRIYLDYQATTPVDPRVVSEMAPYWSDFFGNPHSSDHSFGWQAHEAVESSRAQIASLIGADHEEIIFTSGATESNNLAILGIARAMPSTRRRIIISAIEHKCVIAAARAAIREGFEIVMAPVDGDGIIDLQALEHLIDERTALVSVMAVNNEIGTIQPIREISTLCNKHGALLHSDAAQALSIQPIDVDTSGVDLMSLSAHKIYGPKGIGALYMRKDIAIKPEPITYGGGQEFGFRAGTVPTPLCVGFGKACSILESEIEGEISKLKTLQSAFIDTLRSCGVSFSVNGSTEHRHPGNINIMFTDIDASLLLNAIQPFIAASTGSACSSGIPHPSHVLRAIGLTSEEADSSVRFSFGRFTTHDDILYACKILATETQRIHEAS